MQGSTILKTTASIVAVAGALTVSATANAATLYTVAEQHAGLRVSNPQRFNAIIGFPNQCVAGIICWTYTKGSRTRVATYPETWYLHVNGRRVRDTTFNQYVMDPRSTGWQHQVAKVCGQRCFLDGLGPASLGRTSPVIPWTPIQWTTRAALVVQAVIRAGKQAMPNSVSRDPVLAAPLVKAGQGRASSEGYTAPLAKTILNMGHIWIAEVGGCPKKYAYFLKYEGRGDHFSCYEHGHLPWDTSWLP